MVLFDSEECWNTTMLTAKERSAMAVYMITDISIKDEATYAVYVKKVREIVEKHGGRYLARGGAVTPLTDNWKPERVAIIAFESIEQIQECFSSAEYLKIAPLREESTASRAIVVEGLEQ